MKSQKGFGLVPILLILILISLVGFTGYYVYNQQTKKTDKSEVAGDTTAKASPTPTTAPTTKAAATPTVITTPTPIPQKYLVIKEWGVKLPIDDRTGSASYSIKNNVYSGTFDGKDLISDVATINFEKIKCVPITLLKSLTGSFQQTPGGMGPYYFEAKIGTNFYQGALPAGPIDNSCSQEGLGDASGTFTGNFEYIGALLKKLQAN